MFIIGNMIQAIAYILGMVLQLYMWVIIASAVLSWVNPDPSNPIVRFINNVTEPVFRQIRRYLPVRFGMVDFTPFIVILILIFLSQWIVPSLEEFSRIFLR